MYSQMNLAFVYAEEQHFWENSRHMYWASEDVSYDLEMLYFDGR